MASKHRVLAKPAAKKSAGPVAAKPSLGMKARPFAPRHDDGHDTESSATSMGKAVQARLMDMPVYSPESGANLRRSPTTPEEEKEDPTIQPKLTIGQPGDKYEQEADQMAAQVMRMPEGALAEETEEKEEGLQRQAMPEKEEKDLAQAKFQISRQPMEKEEEDIQMKPSVHRQAMPEDEEEEPLQAKPQIQAKGTAPQVPDNFSGQLDKHKGSGQPLSDETRSFMEPRFGADFSNVRVHETPDLANSIQAQAFTHGQDVYFNSGKYSPGSSGGKELLAHELTHTIQQAELTPKIQKQTDMTFSLGEVEGVDVESLKRVWRSGNKDAFFTKLRELHRLNIVSERKRVNDFIWQELRDDDQWLSLKLLWYGSEAQWPIHLRIEREMKSWANVRGKNAVFDLLRGVNGAHASNAKLTKTLNRVFAPESQDLWLAINLQKHGSEDLWPDDLYVERASLEAGGRRLLKTKEGREILLESPKFRAFLRSSDSTPELIFKALKDLKFLIDVSHISDYQTQAAVADLLISDNAIDRNSARSIIEKEIKLFFIDELEEFSNSEEILKNHKINPDEYSVYITPDATSQLRGIIINHASIGTYKSGNIFLQKNQKLEQLKTTLVHEINHHENQWDKNISGKPVGPSNFDDYAHYRNEFRAYWVSEYRSIEDLDKRAKAIKENILKGYPFIRKAYNNNKTIKKAIDAHMRPDGGDLINN